MNCKDVERNVSPRQPMVPTHHGRTPTIVDRATPVYRALILEFERRRQHIGLRMHEVDDLAGLNDGHFAHMLHVDRPSGRQATWKMLQLLTEALFPAGFDLILKPKAGGALTAEGHALKIKFAAADNDKQTRRALMRELGRKGGIARRENYKTMPREQRLAIARKARKTRRQNCRLRNRLHSQQPEIRSPL